MFSANIYDWASDFNDNHSTTYQIRQVKQIYLNRFEDHTGEINDAGRSWTRDRKPITRESTVSSPTASCSDELESDFLEPKQPPPARRACASGFSAFTSTIDSGSQHDDDDHHPEYRREQGDCRIQRHSMRPVYAASNNSGRSGGTGDDGGRAAGRRQLRVMQSRSQTGLVQLNYTNSFSLAWIKSPVCSSSSSSSSKRAALINHSISNPNFRAISYRDMTGGTRQ